KPTERSQAFPPLRSLGGPTRWAAGPRSCSVTRPSDRVACTGPSRSSRPEVSALSVRAKAQGQRSTTVGGLAVVLVAAVSHGDRRGSVHRVSRLKIRVERRALDNR